MENKPEKKKSFVGWILKDEFDFNNICFSKSYMKISDQDERVLNAKAYFTPGYLQIPDIYNRNLKYFLRHQDKEWHKESIERNKKVKVRITIEEIK